MRIKSYVKYKDSDIPWFQIIPDHWSIERVKDISETKSGTTPLSSNRFYYEDGVHNWIRTTDLNDGELFEVEYKITDLALDECRLKFLPIDTVLVAMYGGFGTIGKNSILKKVSTINQSVCAILPSRHFNSAFFLYFLKYFRNDWKLFADGTRKDPNINQDAVRNLFFIKPPLAEQTAIADYLDIKTQAIDKKVSLLEKKIGYYQELRKSLIIGTLTKGLDKGVKLKESGIDWIGQIPEHWEVKRFKSFAKTIKGKNLETSDIPFENSLPLLSLEYLRNENVKFDTFCYSTDKSLIASKEDLIIVWDGAAVGEILKAKQGYVSSTIAKIKFERTVSSRFFYFLSDQIDYTLKRIPTGMGIPHLNPTVLNNFPCPVPPKVEQNQITEYLERKIGLIEKAVINIQTQITTLKELRKTLINDLVTGKIKVIND